ncbi:MAG TPA: serine/threonine-protein kinase [Polyangiaceae bacterium]|nr:serine/threonine-protein kinase [Polyangiaceae bacterium]
MASFSPTDNLELAPGTQVSNYVIEAIVGRGAQGFVYLARDSLLGRHVALKTLRGGEVGETSGVEEARMLATLEHPNLVRVYHATRQQGVWFIVSEYLPGGSLQDLLQREGKLTLCQALDLSAQAARGLAHVHRLGILHRDVKPQNMLLSRLGEVKLADFGLAQAMQAQRPQVSANVGTPAFRAPEVCAGGSATPASDVFSLGASLFFLLTGRAPFLPDPSSGERESQLRLPGELPRPVRSLLTAMLAASPRKRPSSDLLPTLLSRLAVDPDRDCEQDGERVAERVATPSDASAWRFQCEVLRSGPDRVEVAALGTALDARARGLLLSAPRIEDAALLLQVLREQLGTRYSLLCRDVLTPHSKLRQQLARRLGLDLEANCAAIAERLRPPTPAGLDELRILELHAPRGLIRSQFEDLSELSLTAHAFGLICVVITPNGELAEGSATVRQKLPGFSHFAAWAGGETRELMETRLAQWLRLASDGRQRFSRDGLRLAAQLCIDGGHHWSKLAHRSLLISSGAGMPFVTSWSVLGASTLPANFDSADQLPAALRKAPYVWPTAELATRLLALRDDETKPPSSRTNTSLSALTSNPVQGHGSQHSERTTSHVLDHQQ